jgi:hypothetical protein
MGKVKFAAEINNSSFRKESSDYPESRKAHKNWIPDHGFAVSGMTISVITASCWLPAVC